MGIPPHPTKAGTWKKSVIAVESAWHAGIRSSRISWLVYGCPYLNFSRASSVMDLITRQVIGEREGDLTEARLEAYTNPETAEYRGMLDDIRKKLNFTSLEFNRMDDMIDAIGLPACKLCTHCFNGKG